MKTRTNNPSPRGRWDKPRRAKPEWEAPQRGPVEQELEALRGRLLLAQESEVEQLDLLPALRRASNEASALAWDTPFPLLVFPELFREKARSALEYSCRQAALKRGRTAAGMIEAA